MEKVLTGVRDLDMKIINQLNDYELTQVCQVNKYVNNICNDEIFWMNRVVNKFGKYLGTAEEIKKKYLFGVYEISWQKYYKLLMRYLKNYPEKIVRRQTVKDHFYKYFGKTLKRKDFVKILDVKHGNNSLLENYAENDNYEKVVELVESTDRDFITLQYGFFTDDINIGRYLLNKGTKPDDESILYAVDRGNYGTVELLAQNSDIDLSGFYWDPKIIEIALETGRTVQDETYSEFIIDRVDDLSREKLIKIFNIIND